MGIEDITHAVDVEETTADMIIGIHVNGEGEVKITFPEERMSIEDCAKIMFTATNVVLNNIKERGAMKEVDPKVLEELRNKK